MYKQKTISLVIPARNEEILLPDTIKNIPELFDKIIIIDDCSSDNTPNIIKEFAAKNDKISFIIHEINLGVGQSIIDGYLLSLKLDIDIAVVIGGDNQMDLSEVEKFLNPIIDNKADYVKGNRFWLYEKELERMPKIRVIGNTIISLLTKLSSGYYNIFDVVDGYTAISKKAIRTINWDKAWKGYGYPMDFLMRLNLNNFRVLDVPRKSIYLEGYRQSQIKGINYLFKVSPMLLKNFFYRLYNKYLLRNFHPLVFLYLLSFILLPLGVIDGIYLIIHRLFGGGITAATAIFCALLIISGLQFFIFAMLFDILEDKNNKGNYY